MKDIEILVKFAKEYKDKGYFGIIKAEQIQILDNLLKERQADKEKIKELGKDYAEMLIKLNAQNLNNSIELIKRSNEQVEALNDAWKIEWEKKDNRIKELESDKEIKDKTIKLMAEHLTTPIHSKKDVVEYFENLAKESGEIDEY